MIFRLMALEIQPRCAKKSFIHSHATAMSTVRVSATSLLLSNHHPY
jgi:hypothetical protein